MHVCLPDLPTLVKFGRWHLFGPCGLRTMPAATDNSRYPGLLLDGRIDGAAAAKPSIADVAAWQCLFEPLDALRSDVCIVQTEFSKFRHSPEVFKSSVTHCGVA